MAESNAHSTHPAPTATEVSKLRSRRGPVVFIRATAEAPEQFQGIVSIDNIDYLTQAVSLTALFNGAIDETGRFVSATARQIISDYNAALPASDKPYQIGIFSVNQSVVTQTNSAVSGMIDQVLEFLKTVVGVALGTASVEQMSAAITDAFTNLKTQEGDAWIFWEKKTANKTSYSYCILFAIQDETTGRLMFALPMSMEIEVDVSFERVLWITVEDKETYSVKIETMKVGQILFPKPPGSDAVRQALAPMTSDPTDSMLQMQAISNVVVQNWSKTKTFATSQHGVYERTHHLQQLMMTHPHIHLPIEPESKYMVTFTKNGNRESIGFIFNAILPDGTLWFVSM
jgi:hypothetical protein